MNVGAKPVGGVGPDGGPGLDDVVLEVAFYAGGSVPGRHTHATRATSIRRRRDIVVACFHTAFEVSNL